VANSPYLVTGDVTIGSGNTLTIEAGVEVRFLKVSDDQSSGQDANRCELNINGGSLIAEGTASDSIYFVSNAESPGDDDWYGIYNGWEIGTVRLSYVSYRHASYVFRGGFSFYGNQSDSLRITHSHFRDMGNNVFQNVQARSNARITIRNNTFSDYSQFIESTWHVRSGALLRIENNEFNDGNLGRYEVSDTTSQFYFRNNISTSRGYMDVRSTVENSSIYQVTIEDNQLSASNNSQDQLYLRGGYWSEGVKGSFLVKDNTLDNISISVESVEQLLVQNNTITNNEQNNAVRLYNSNAVVENNTIQDNSRSGVYVYADFDHQAVTDTIRNNTIVSNNTSNNDYYAGVSIEEYANPVIWYNDIYDNNYYDVRNNSQYNDIDARFNWWGTTTTATMDAGGNPKNINKIYDTYDDNTLGTVNYASWLSDEATRRQNQPNYHLL